MVTSNDLSFAYAAILLPFILSEGYNEFLIVYLEI